MLTSLKDFHPTTSQGLVVFEGVNGAGKSTLQRKLFQHYTTKNIPTITSQEPGGTPFGKHLRELLLNNPGDNRTPLAEAFIFSADRAEHVEKILRPALEEKKLVLLDRYYYSTIAFQGYGRGLPINPLMAISKIATNNLQPDLVLLLDLDPEEGLRRNSEKEEVDSFEQEKLEFHTRLRDGFLELARSLPEPFVILNAQDPPEQLFEEATSFIDKIIHNNS